MKRQIFWLIGSASAVGVLALGFLAIKPMAKARVVVRDDSGPVAGIPVNAFGFLKWEDGRGVTDQNGVANIHFQSFSGTFEVDAVKHGYYYPLAPRRMVQFRRRNLFSWDPWPLDAEVLIRRIGKPVAMYAKAACAHFDVFGQPRGYDMVIGDLVAPHGVGKTNDFIFEIQRETTPDRTNRTMRLTFANPGDGIQPSRVPGYGRSTLVIPALAPTQGYRSKWVVGSGSEDGENEILKTSEPDEEVNYYFRVRTWTGPDGSVVGGLYGKIYDGFYFSTQPDADPNERGGCSPGVSFTYYLNPDGTRNTEYSGQNLLQGEGTQVRSP